MDPLVYKARIFAMAAHAAVGQVRNYTGLPYIVHPIEVADILAKAGYGAQVQAAGLLHDVLEDTAVTYELIEEEFGLYVAELVRSVTNVAKKEDGIRKVRSLINLNHKAKADPDGQSIVYADIMSNMPSLPELKPDFAKVYVREKYAVLMALDKGDEDLRHMALEVVEAAAASLGIDLREESAGVVNHGRQSQPGL